VEKTRFKTGAKTLEKREKIFFYQYLVALKGLETPAVT
jgi:hypothetical protein